MKIPCETIVRMAHLLPSPNVEIDPIFRTLRLENGKIIATDRRFMAIEQLSERFEGVYHLAVTDVFLAQCKVEAPFSGVFDAVPTPPLRYTTGKTTFGWSPSDNLGVYPDGPTAFDNWYQMVVAPCIEPAAVSRGGMMWLLDDIQRLAASSPSGTVVFEQNIDCDNRPSVVRDLDTPDWCGFFLPRLHNGAWLGGATVPGWLK